MLSPLPGPKCSVAKSQKHHWEKYRLWSGGWHLFFEITIDAYYDKEKKAN